MKVIIFGATGMVGGGVLRECLTDPDVSLVQTIGRSPTKQVHTKLKELVQANLLDYDAQQDQLAGFDACFFCLGASSSGKSEAEYSHLTYDLTLAAAKILLRLNPQLTFIYVSGVGADSNGKSKTMWARVRGKTESDLLKMTFKAAYIFRPAFIQAKYGVESKTTSYRILYKLLKPSWPLLRLALPSYTSTTENIGKAMLAVVRNGYDHKILTSRDFNILAARKTRGPSNE